MSKQHIIFVGNRDSGKKQLSRSFRHDPTDSERRIWGCLRNHRMCGLHFRRQVVIGPFIADFYCHAIRLVVEIDGSIHLSRKEMDAERDKYFDALGILTLRIPNESINKEINQAMEIIRMICLERRDKVNDENHPAPNPSP